jgi:LysR family transcriptional regulator, glycine cleavage system transcriptional activator
VTFCNISVHMSKTPSIQTLRAFEASGRLQSYTKAAEALGITHGAISHRIRDLEQDMGITLFERIGHTMVPTARAHGLLVQVRQILGLLDSTFPPDPGSGSGSGKHRTDKHNLIISVLPAFASHWLIKRLPEFNREHPQINVDLRVSPDLIDLASSDIDAAIRYGPGDWQRTVAVKLCNETLFPVCAPALLERYVLVLPADILSAPLLRSSWQPWTPWLTAAGLSACEPDSGSQFSDVGLMVQSAVAGHGIALARSLLVCDLIESGQLIRLFDVSVSDIYSYFLVVADNKPRSETLLKFEKWIIANNSFQSCQSVV